MTSAVMQRPRGAIRIAQAVGIAADRASPIAGRRWTLIHMMLAREDHWTRANRLGLIVTAQQPLLYTLAGAGSTSGRTVPATWSP